MAKAGVSSTKARDVMRHKDVATTLDDYTELDLEDKLESLGAVPPKKSLRR